MSEEWELELTENLREHDEVLRRVMKFWEGAGEPREWQFRFGGYVVSVSDPYIRIHDARLLGKTIWTNDDSAPVDKKMLIALRAYMVLDDLADV